MPATPNRPAGLNRSLLTLVGVLLLLAGGYILARGLGLLPGIGPIPTQDPGTTLVPTGTSAQPWVPYPVIAIAVVIGIGCVLWLLAQTGRRRASSQTWRMTGDPGQGATLLSTDAAATAFAAEIETYPGIQRAAAAITGDRTQPFLQLTVTTAAETSITELRRKIDIDALTHVREALELDDLPAEILLRIGAKQSTSRIG
jgi:hypothetical protein